MQKHDWLLGVCQDLTDYAMINGLENFEDHMQRAVLAARYDVMLATLDSRHERQGNVVRLDPNIAFYKG
ncbi:MAG: hypothetical protein ABJO71_17755 [Pseudoruegeria sp.]